MSPPTGHPALPAYQALFHGSPAPRPVVATELRIGAVNDACLQATATTPEELRGRRGFDAFP